MNRPESQSPGGGQREPSTPGIAHAARVGFDGVTYA